MTNDRRPQKERRTEESPAEERRRERPERRVLDEDELVDEAGRESFPASDPPANSPRPPSKRRDC